MSTSWVVGRDASSRHPGKWGRGLCVVTILTASFLCSCDRIVLNFQGNPSDSGVGPGFGGEASIPPEPPPAPELVVLDDFNLSRRNLAPRDCSDGGESVAYSVLSLQGRTLELSVAPAAGCLSPGDELLLIELQGSATSRERVGRHELLRFEESNDAVITLTSKPTQAYGVGSMDDWEAGGSTILLQRVPNFSRVLVSEGATLTASAWGENGSGVLVLRAIGEAVIDGKVEMNGAGFRGGMKRPEAMQHGQQGESIRGPGGAFTEANDGGGGGGLGDQAEAGCSQDGNAGGGGAHWGAGDDARVADLCGGEGRGRGGVAYAQVGKLFFGSGGGSGGMDNVTEDNPPGAPGGSGGGIVWLLAQSIGGGGSIESRGANGVGDPAGVECLSGGSQSECYDHSGPGGGGAGGTVRLSAPRISGVLVDVAGGLGGNGYDTAGGNGGSGAPGVADL